MPVSTAPNPTQKPPYGPLIADGSSFFAGLLGDWLFREGGGLKTYDALGRITGTLHGTTTWTTTPQGPAITFPGTSGNGVSLDGVALDIAATPCTVLLRFSVANGATANGYLLSCVDENAFVGYTAQIGVNTVGRVGWFGGDKSWVDVHANTLNDGALHTLIIVINSATSAVSYVDNFSTQMTFTTSNDMRPATNLALTTRYFGGPTDGSGDAPFAGVMDRVAVWNRALLPGEANAILTAPYAMYSTRPARRWRVPPPTGASPNKIIQFNQAVQRAASW